MNQGKPKKSICGELLGEIPAHPDRTYNSYMPLQTFADATHREIAKDVLIEFYEYMTNRNIRIWPMFGTLLGMVRNDDLIPHDADIDFGYLRTERERLVSALDELHDTNGYSITRNQFSNLLSLHKNAVMVDLYEYEIDEGRRALLQGHRREYDILFEEAFPFRTISFRGEKLHCIHNPEAFFERYYGDDWRTPK